MKKLPIGIQTFSIMREENYYYVDKTEYIHKLLENGKYYFLARPRRFGKSCFLDTLKEAFEGNKKLFEGLFLENLWDWSKKYPVIKISFGSGVLKKEEDLDQRIIEILDDNAKLHGVELTKKSISGRFIDLITELHKKYSARVAILIDEYDKPILDNIEDKEIAITMRDGLKNLYSVVKDLDAHIQFVFIVGVSKFSKVSLFSGLNNLLDITLDDRYSSICGYTEKELEIFAENLQGVDRKELKRWYNGYNFLGDKVYNPFDILLFLDKKEFKNYWFETGNPSFLMKLIELNHYNTIKMENIELSEEDLGAFDVNSIHLETLLFQAGYLTIKDKKIVSNENYYTMCYPNEEVRRSLNARILASLSSNIVSANKTRKSLYFTIQKNDLDSLKTIFHSFFASIPNDWYRKNKIANYEGYYASIFYSYFSAVGFDVRAEEVTNNGRVDMTIFFEGRVYVFEFKVNQLTEPGSALAQIKEKKYYEKYLTPDQKEIYLIGVEFSSEDRNITRYEWEKVS